MGEVREPTEHLLRRAGEGEPKARDLLLERYRERLRRSVALRLDDRVAARLDASDIVQEVLVTAARRLDEFIVQRPMPFLDWLKRMARDRIIDAHRTHIMAGRRSVVRESLEATDSAISCGSELNPGFVSEPSYLSNQSDRLADLQEALTLLRPADRELVIWRHMENLPPSVIAARLGINENAAKVRIVRALIRLREILIVH